MYFSRDQLDKTIYEHIRRMVVAAGWYPDELLYMNGNPQDLVNFKTARDLIRTDKGSLIEVIGMSNAETRAERALNRIVINRMGLTQGDIGASGTEFHRPVTDPNSGQLMSYDRLQYPDATRNVQYNINLVAESYYTLGIMQEIIDDALGTQRSIESVDMMTRQLTGPRLTIIQTGEANLSAPKNIEYVYMYSIRNVFVNNPKVLATGIAPINTISPKAQINTDDPQDLLDITD